MELRVGVCPHAAAFLRHVASWASAVAAHPVALLRECAKRERGNYKRDDGFVHGRVPFLLVVANHKNEKTGWYLQAISY